jgi:quercetin dioxygenase-like cupin family protein
MLLTFINEPINNSLPMEKPVNLFDETSWMDAPGYPAGTKKRILYNEKGVETFLVKMPADSMMAPHAHPVAEQNFVLKGEYVSNGITYSEGSFRHFNPGETHGPFETKDGFMGIVIHYPQ